MEVNRGDLSSAELHVVALSPSADWYERVCQQAAILEPDDVVLALPAGYARVMADRSAVIEGFRRSSSSVLAEAGCLALVGIAGVLAEQPRIEEQKVDDAGLVFHRFQPYDGSSLVLNGRVVAASNGRESPVVLYADVDEFNAALADGADRDLLRVLRYDDAIDDDPAWYLASAEILDVSFWTPSFCATVIRAAEATGAFMVHADDPVPGHEVSLAAISPRLYSHVEQHVGERVMPLVNEVWPYVDYQGLRDVFVVKYALGLQTELRIHHDLAQVSGSVLLNSGYEGGRLEFPRQNFSNQDSIVGRALIWPSLVTHPHRSTPLVSGVKYALTMWFELPGLHVG